MFDPALKHRKNDVEKPRPCHVCPGKPDTSDGTLWESNMESPRSLTGGLKKEISTQMTGTFLVVSSGVIKHGNGQSPMNGGFDRKITGFYGPWLPARHVTDDTGGYTVYIPRCSVVTVVLEYESQHLPEQNHPVM